MPIIPCQAQATVKFLKKLKNVQSRQERVECSTFIHEEVPKLSKVKKDKEGHFYEVAKI